MNRKYEYATDKIITLSAIKVTNTEHTAINGNHSKCRMTHILSFRKLRNEPNIKPDVPVLMTNTSSVHVTGHAYPNIVATILRGPP